MIKYGEILVKKNGYNNIVNTLYYPNIIDSYLSLCKIGVLPEIVSYICKMMHCMTKMTICGNQKTPSIYIGNCMYNISNNLLSKGRYYDNPIFFHNDIKFIKHDNNLLYTNESHFYCLKITKCISNTHCILLLDTYGNVFKITDNRMIHLINYSNIDDIIMCSFGYFY